MSVSVESLRIRNQSCDKEITITGNRVEVSSREKSRVVGYLKQMRRDSENGHVVVEVLDWAPWIDRSLGFLRGIIAPISTSGMPPSTHNEILVGPTTVEKIEPERQRRTQRNLV